MSIQKIAKVGQVIEWIDPKYFITLRGKVLFIYENSVGVELLDYNAQLKEMFVTERTVVNHKRYIIVEEVEAI